MRKYEVDRNVRSIRVGERVRVGWKKRVRRGRQRERGGWNKSVLSHWGRAGSEGGVIEWVRFFSKRERQRGERMEGEIEWCEKEGWERWVKWKWGNENGDREGWESVAKAGQERGMREEREREGVEEERCERSMKESERKGWEGWVRDMVEKLVWGERVKRERESGVRESGEQ